MICLHRHRRPRMEVSVEIMSFVITIDIIRTASWHVGVSNLSLSCRLARVSCPSTVDLQTRTGHSPGLSRPCFLIMAILRVVMVRQHGRLLGTKTSRMHRNPIVVKGTVSAQDNFPYTKLATPGVCLSADAPSPRGLWIQTQQHMKQDAQLNNTHIPEHGKF